MNARRFDRDHDQSEFDALVSLGSDPPPPSEVGDVHSARTTIAVLPDDFLEDLRRGKADEPPTARYQTLPDPDALERETPTPAPVPPPDARTTLVAAEEREGAGDPSKLSEARVRELNAAISAALTVAMPKFDPPPDTAPPERGMAMPLVPAELPRPWQEERWVLILLAVAVVFAFLASAGTSAFRFF